MIDVNYYSYAELKDAVIKEPSIKNVEALGIWFERYGTDYWNGEYYDADDGIKIYPIYQLDEYGDVTLVGYELK